ncbi:hypothetical protein [Microvirga tunisiensis]|uniref:hypothetical protein n=1 Tax=Microvirga tunisiensis TaxID=2108360 RepID=UPI00129C20FC|nr:hypothetical protein [Microvirga tunisiensis]
MTDHVPRNQIVTLGSSGACIREAGENGYEDGGTSLFGGLRSSAFGLFYRSDV